MIVSPVALYSNLGTCISHVVEQEAATTTKFSQGADKTAPLLVTVHKAGEKGQGYIYASKPSRHWVAPWLPALTAGIIRALLCLPGMVKAALDAAQAEFRGHQTQQAQSAVVSRSDVAQTY